MTKKSFIMQNKIKPNSFLNLNGLKWWDEQAIQKREAIINLLRTDIKKILYDINPAIQIFQIETPCLIPEKWAKGHLPFYKIDTRYALRGESTQGTYEVMDKMQLRMPVALYQVNKSFRDETTGAIRESHYRYREFWQMEFQLFYAENTKADYHELFIENIKGWGKPLELPKNDLPPYSTRTTDLEIDKIEVASLSTRKDYKTPVFEMSFGLDRLIQLYF